MAGIRSRNGGRPVRCLPRLHLGLGRHGARGGHANDIAFDHEIIGPAEHHQMLDIVPTQQNQLALAVEIIDINDSQSRLPTTSALAARHGETIAADAFEHDREQGQQYRNDRKSDDVLHDG